MVHPTPLAAKVAAANNAHAYALKLYPALADFFADFVGVKIEKVDGTLLKKIADALEKVFPETGVPSTRLHVYRHTSNYSLAWTVKACESSPGKNSRPGDEYQIANYYEITVYIGDMRDGVLTKISNPPTLRTDYTVEHVNECFAAVKAAEKALSDARSALWPFKESDTY